MEIQPEVDIYFSFFIGTFLFLLLAIALILFFLVYRKRLFEQELQLEKKESHHRLELLKNTIEITEQERKRIASDLHDEIGSHLSSIRMALNNINAKLIGQPEIIKLSNDGKEAIDQTIESVRTISHNLLPPGLDLFGFINTASDLCQKLSNTSGIQITFNADFAKRFSADVELALYRIIQELLTNSFRHASPKTIAINVLNSPDNISINYRDDGKGFDYDPLSPQKGLGIRNIESRIMVLNGQLSIDTQPGNGFLATITVPTT